MKNNHMIHLLKQLSHFSRPVSELRIRKSVLENTKNERKGLKKDEILERGLNIYEKRAKSIDLLIEEGIDSGFLDLYFDECRNEYQLKMTDKGRNHLIGLFTNQYCEEYIRFEKEVNELTDKKEETAFSKDMIASMFYHGRTIEYVEKHYFSDRVIQQEVSTFHTYYMDKLGIKLEDDEYLLHIMPQLFLPTELVGEPVSLKIEGVEIQETIVLGSPYPNKRYVVAGTKKDGEKLLTGFYVKGNREVFEKGNVVRYIWTVGDDAIFVHELNLMFDFDKGRLFSTTQVLSRNGKLPHIDLKTFVEECYLEERNRHVSIVSEGEDVFIKEEVLLTSFPSHLHYSFGGNKTFQDWVVKKLYS